MKQLSLRITLVILLIAQVCIAQQALKLQPEKPKPGDKVSVVYDPDGTELSGVENPEAYGYLLEGDLPVVREIKLKKSGKVYTGELNTNDTTKAVFLSFSKDEKRDNNGHKGYYTFLYDNTGMPLVNSRMNVATAYGNYARMWGMKTDPETALKFHREELKVNPAVLKKSPVLVARGLYSSDDEADIAIVNAALNQILAQPAPPEADLSAAKSIYLEKFKNKAKAEEIDSIIRQRFPNGSWALRAKAQKVSAEKDLDAQVAMFETLKKELENGSTEDKRWATFLAGNIAQQYGNAGNFQKMHEYAKSISSKSSLARIYNSVAWKHSGESVDGKPGDLKGATQLSAKSLELLKEMIKESIDRPVYLTESQYRKNLERDYDMYADTYALLLYHAKDYQQAYDIQKKLIESSKRADRSTNEAFARYTEKTQGAKAAIRELESFAKEGTHTPRMKEQLKRLYLAENNPEASWNAYVGKLEAVNLEKKKAELMKQMINEVAPSFTLKDMQGSQVTLASLKGKVVVVDFWATWCGPCKASFPGMKQAIEKYKDDKDVKFVFIDTWENGEADSIKKNVAAFIEKNAYPFHVLMDMDSKVVEAFKVEGIPTKFVIDTNNKIRFRSVGFDGSDEGLVSEMSMMIDMTKGATASGATKKAF